MANLIINFKTDKIELILQKSKKSSDRLNFDYKNDLDTLLIASIDKILEKNRMEITSLKYIRITGNINKNSLAFKIAKTVVIILKIKLK